MGINSAFNNAFSGLNASSRRAEMVSNNISNAMTDGFGRREITLSSDVLNGFGGGVRVTDVTRVENAVLSSSRREAEADLGRIAVEADFASRVSSLLGNPGEPSALAVQYADFETSLVAAANQPSNQIILDKVVTNASQIASKFNSVSETLNSLRLEADTEIARQVSQVNDTVAELSDLNVEIRKRKATEGSTAALKDQQDLLVDRLNSMIPVKVVERDFGRIAVYTPTGGTLLNDRPTVLEFSQVSAMSHSFSVGSGMLSDLSVEGVPVGMSSESSFFAGGSIGALFKMRDQILPEYNDRVDALATDLASRFQSPSVDPTLAAADPGLFTDAGAQFSAANQLGFAGRVAINSLVDPNASGESWRLRAGLNAVGQGEVGDNQVLSNYRDAFQTSQAPAIGMGTAVHLGATEFASYLAADVSHESVELEDKQAFRTSKSEELREAELSVTSVDTDRELQNLIEVENAYAANARVMKVLEELMTRLLEI